MDIATKAWTTDGYLDYQEQMRNIPYGKYTIGEKGCGFIAAFNALKASVNPQDIDSVYNWFNKTLFAGARWGTNIFQMVAFLIKHKAFKGFKLTKKGYSDLNVGILLYNVGG